MGYSLMMDQVQHQVVEKVLQDYLDGEDLNSAVTLWDRQYRNQSIDKLSFFVFEIATSSTLRSLRKQILSELEQNLAQNETIETSTQAQEASLTAETQLVDEAKIILDSTQDNPQDIAPPVLNIDALNSLLAQLLQHLNAFDYKERVSVFNEYVDDLTNMPVFIKDELLLIFISEHQAHYIAYDEQHVRTALNIIYSVLCEYFGPVKTDRLFSQTVAETSQKFPSENIMKFL